MGYWDRLRWIDRFARCDTYKKEKPIIKYGKTTSHQIQDSDVRNLRKEETKCIRSQKPVARREEVEKDRVLVSEVQKVRAVVVTSIPPAPKEAGILEEVL